MPKLEKYNNLKEVHHSINQLGFGWKRSTHFTPKNIISAGRKYKIIYQFDREFSFTEKIIRFSQAIWIVIFSLGKEWNSKKVKSLFKAFESKRFAVISSNNHPFPQKSIVVSERKGEDLTLKMVKTVQQHIFSFLDKDDLLHCHPVSKHWNQAAEDNHLRKTVILKHFIECEKNEWLKLGDIGPIPPLPNNFYNIMKRKCPFFPNSTIGETHKLILIPETLNGKRLNLHSIPEKFAKIGFFSDISPWAINQLDTQIKSTRKTHWALITREVLPHSYKKNTEQLKEVLANYLKTSELNYEIPNTIDACVYAYFHCSQIVHNKNQSLLGSYCVEYVGNQVITDPFQVVTYFHSFPDLRYYFSIYNGKYIKAVSSQGFCSGIGLTPILRFI